MNKQKLVEQNKLHNNDQYNKTDIETPIFFQEYPNFYQNPNQMQPISSQMNPQIVPQQTSPVYSNQLNQSAFVPACNDPVIGKNVSKGIANGRQLHQGNNGGVYFFTPNGSKSYLTNGGRPAIAPI